MDFDLMITSLPKLLSAAVITLKLLSASLIIGLFIGFLFAVLRLNKNPFINKFAYGYSYLFRGTPLLVQIFIIYFGLGQVEWIRESFLWIVLKKYSNFLSYYEAYLQSRLYKGYFGKSVSYFKEKNSSDIIINIKEICTFFSSIYLNSLIIVSLSIDLLIEKTFLFFPFICVTI